MHTKNLPLYIMSTNIEFIQMSVRLMACLHGSVG